MINKIKSARAQALVVSRLEREEKQERHHQTEKSHSFGQGETQNGVREELLLQRWITRVADDQRAKYATDTRAGTSDADGGGAGADVLGRGVDVHSASAGLEASHKAGRAAGGG